MCSVSIQYALHVLSANESESERKTVAENCCVCVCFQLLLQRSASLVQLQTAVEWRATVPITTAAATATTFALLSVCAFAFAFAFTFAPLAVAAAAFTLSAKFVAVPHHLCVRLSAPFASQCSVGAALQTGQQQLLLLALHCTALHCCNGGARQKAWFCFAADLLAFCACFALPDRSSAKFCHKRNQLFCSLSFSVGTATLMWLTMVVSVVARQTSTNKPPSQQLLLLLLR